MKTFELKLFSLKCTSNLKIESNKNEIDEFVFWLLSIFAKDNNIEDHKITIETLQQKTEQLTGELNKFVESNKGQFPEIYKLRKFNDMLENNEYFFILQNTNLDTSQNIELSNQLKAINQSKDYCEIDISPNGLFGFALENYNMISFPPDKSTGIGEPFKINRVCRFCQGKFPEVSFRKKAHAISEALGNKSIISNEECDSCNDKFGKGIEVDIISYLNFHRSFYGIKGKKSGFPKLKGNNFSIQRLPNNSVEFKIICNSKELPSHINAQFYERVSFQNIYRALCKYVISTINSTELKFLKKTVEWINGDFTEKALPNVKMQTIPHFFSKQPGLNVFIRKNSNIEIPHLIGEFRFVSTIFVFIVPFSVQDDRRFLKDEEFNHFWSNFHYSKGKAGKSWATLDLSDSHKRKLVIDLDFNKIQ